jgi:Mg2+/citrate symporter
MEFILGVFVAALFFCFLFLAYWMGTRQTKKLSEVNISTEDEQRQKEQIKQYNEHFKKLFKYDVDTALQRKKVM